jgi:hypothetical protein
MSLNTGNASVLRGYLGCQTAKWKTFSRGILERFVKNEAFEWGDNVTKSYFELAEKDADGQWAFVQRFLAPFPIDYNNTMELSCGHGRNSEKL